MGKKKFAVLIISALMMCAFCMTAQADAFSDEFDRKVFEGKDGWLFYSGDDTIEDYRGTDLFTVRELESIRQRLTAFRDTLALQGCEFVILIAPNKEQVYSQYMPDSYGQLTPYTRAQQVTDYLTAFGFRVIYPVDELEQAAEEHPEYDIYYRKDTHWTDLGAYIGARALMAELGIDMPPLEDLFIVPYPHDSADLGRAIDRSLKDTGYAVEGFIDESMDSFDVVSDYIYHSQKSGVDDRRVLLVGDSFSLSLYPYVIQEFNDVTVSLDKTGGIQQLLEAVHPDIYIYEVVERYVNLLDSSYGLEAPYSWTIESLNLMQ